MNDIKDYIAKYVKLLPVGTSLSYAESERRASDFLVAQSTLIDWKHGLSSEKIRLLSIQTAVYAEQMAKNVSKTVTETKMLAEASPEYAKAREELEAIDNDISYLKAYLQIFADGHIFFRQLSKENK